ncbi:MAG: transposase, partial [Treponema sp.]
MNKIILCFESPTATATAKIVGVNRNTVNRYFN